ncbi:ATPase [Granulicella tundricola]|uniref:ATP-dependent carboxylate-amine ligase domain protein ATP-grasp n=1 Tax=Granulicella tundricola (strain ATCC BAA-1859 / DSM 23138 / MP5ACTX9) TaxID=1198114 RepID=E8X1E5_GRATM|nr:ATPase [Granulicella tundricola]ADW69099.1 ATP-dependent carboxylate-amine ligase domain protein ATP-grasp [Granulicella tundricola MP5ACTX9]
MSEWTSGTSGKPAIFCISTYVKGQAFLREAAALGCEVTLLTVDRLRDDDWPKDILHELLTMPEDLTPGQILNTVMYLARTRRIDRIVPLDEFDLEAAALLREHMRLPGLGETATRFFRDKLAMRTEAKKAGIAVPEFTGVFNYDDLRAFMRNVPGPWLLKPRTSASAIGIRRIEHEDQLWPALDELGDLQSHYVMERFVSGEVFHVEGVTWGGKVLFAQPFQYGKPPMQTMHQGGVFTTRTLELGSKDGKGLLKIHESLIAGLHMHAGVTHSEFIRADADGRFYFLETAARVGGAYIAETLEFATGVNPWVEWARIEVALAKGEEYKLPELRKEYAGSVISLAKQETPDTSGYTDPEIVLRLHKTHHAGIILKSGSEPRLKSLVESYAGRFLDDFCAVMAVPDKPTA